MAQERLVAVSYPADSEFAQMNSEVLAGDANVVYTYELDDAQRTQTLQRAEALLAWDLAKEIPAGALQDRSALRFAQLLSAGVDAVDFSALPERLTVASKARAFARAESEHVLAISLSLAKLLPPRPSAPTSR